MISRSKMVAVDGMSKSYSDKSRVEPIGFSIGWEVRWEREVKDDPSILGFNHWRG